jgi:hypothetical protein
MKDQLASNRGLLCFSRHWNNPVQWSHYAAKHTGLCLGFDIPGEHLGAVTYSRKRLVVEAESFHNPRELSVETVTKFQFTKYSHWRYENEVRCFQIFCVTGDNRPNAAVHQLLLDPKL